MALPLAGMAPRGWLTARAVSSMSRRRRIPNWLVAPIMLPLAVVAVGGFFFWVIVGIAAITEGSVLPGTCAIIGGWAILACGSWIAERVIEAS